jgi:hypothetical protein
MRRMIWFSGICSILLIVLVACGLQNPVSKAPVGESLYVLDTTNPGTNGYAGSHIIAFHPDNATISMMLPTGLFSQDHKRIYNAVSQGTRTTITITNALTGSTLHSFTITGNYSTAGTPYTTSDITTDGRWLALRATDQAGGTIALIDTQKEKLAKTLSLGQNFYLDAISPDGGTLFLLQYLPGQNGRYYVRSYDVNANHLNAGIFADKDEINDPRMLGSALTRQMAQNGKFAYTLYVDTTRNIAFVHMLPLIQGNNLPYPPNIARCLDLPLGKSAQLLRYYTLALSSDGSTLYAANGALGVIAKIALTDTLFDSHVSLVRHFDPGQVSPDGNGNGQPLYNGAVLSPDNKTLYFAGAQGIWSLRTNDIQLEKSYLTQQMFTSIALSSDGRMLYAVHPQSGITLIDVASGQSTQITPSPTHNPWGIVWVAG